MFSIITMAQACGHVTLVEYDTPIGLQELEYLTSIRQGRCNSCNTKVKMSKAPPARAVRARK